MCASFVNINLKLEKIIKNRGLYIKNNYWNANYFSWECLCKCLANVFIVSILSALLAIYKENKDINRK